MTPAKFYGLNDLYRLINKGENELKEMKKEENYGKSHFLSSMIGEHHRLLNSLIELISD